MQFSPRASSAMGAATGTKFGTKIVYGMKMMLKLQIHALRREISWYHTRRWKIWRALQWRTSNRQQYEWRHIARRCRDGAL